MDTGYLGQMVAGLAYLAAGLGLLRLALRTGERPERLLGIYFVLAAADYLFYTIPLVFGMSEEVYLAGSALSRVSYAVGVVALLLFTREVFRAGERWAGALSWLCVLGLFGGLAGSFALGNWEGARGTETWLPRYSTPPQRGARAQHRLRSPGGAWHAAHRIEGGRIGGGQREPQSASGRLREGHAAASGKASRGRPRGSLSSRGQRTVGVRTRGQRWSLRG